MIESIYILGNHIQALGLSRLAYKAGLTVSIFNDKKISIARYSNTCKQFRLFRDKIHLLELLRKSARGKNTLLVATNDSLIDFMKVNYDELSQLYHLSIPEPDVVEICYNKRSTYLKAQELGIPIPESYFPDNLEELKDLAGSIRYPVILKPAVMHTFHQVTGKKVLFCKDKEDLLSSYERIVEIIPPDEVIVQEFLKGGAKTLYSYGSFAANKTIYGSLSANRIRQNPMDFGNSTCYAVTVAEPTFEALAIKFLQEINYFGMSEVEFMLDTETGVYKMLEINPRAWKWHSIANKLDINFMQMMVDYLEGREVKPKHNDQIGVAWIERFTDTYIALNEIFHSRMKFRDYWKTITVNKESAVWSVRDPLPAIMYCIYLPFLFIQR
jgi:predicted ATP-grasp superfamily ATP-dependent carboligase